MLSKYTAVFLPLGVGLTLLTQREHRHWLLKPAPWLALVVAAVVFSPVIIWNAGHGWISFAFQGDRAVPGFTLRPLRLIVDLAIQSLYFLPPIWVGLMIALGRGLGHGPARPRHWFTAILAVGPIAFFALVWLVARQGNHGYHWAAPGYLMLYPLYGLFVAERARVAPREARWWFVGSGAVFAALLVAYLGYTLTGWGQAYLAPQAGRDPLLVDQTDWRDLRPALAERGLLDPARTYVLAFGWPQCVRADYGLGGAMPVVCKGADTLAVDRATTVTQGKDAVIVSLTPQLAGGVSAAQAFSSVEPLGPVAITNRGVRAETVWLFRGHAAAN